MAYCAVLSYYFITLNTTLHLQICNFNCENIYDVIACRELQTSQKKELCRLPMQEGGGDHCPSTHSISFDPTNLNSPLHSYCFLSPCWYCSTEPSTTLPLVISGGGPQLLTLTEIKRSNLCSELSTFTTVIC